MTRMNIVRALSPHAFARGDDREPQTPFFFPHVDLLIASTTALIATGWSDLFPLSTSAFSRRTKDAG